MQYTAFGVTLATIRRLIKTKRQFTYLTCTNHVSIFGNGGLVYLFSWFHGKLAVKWAWQLPGGLTAHNTGVDLDITVEGLGWGARQLFRVRNSKIAMRAANNLRCTCASVITGTPRHNVCCNSLIYYLELQHSLNVYQWTCCWHERSL